MTTATTTALANPIGFRFIQSNGFVKEMDTCPVCGEIWFINEGFNYPEPIREQLNAVCDKCDRIAQNLIPDKILSTLCRGGEIETYENLVHAAVGHVRLETLVQKTYDACQSLIMDPLMDACDVREIIQAFGEFCAGLNIRAITIKFDQAE